MKDTERLAYQIHANVDRVYQAKKRAAIGLLERFSRQVSRPYLSMSWGKDSMVSFMLARHVFGNDLRMVYVNCGEFDEWPDTERVKRLMCERFNINLIEVQAESVIECFRRVGYFYVSPAKTKQERKSDRLYSASFLAAISDATQDCDGIIMGLRADESAGRAALFKFRGALYHRESDGKTVCCPVHDWTADDIWTCHAEYDLPYNELYDCELLPSAKLRNGAMFGGTGSGRGAIKVVQMLYPDLFNRFAIEFPGITRYA